MAGPKVAIVSGANRGIGFEVARQLARDHSFHVVLGCRDMDKGSQAADLLHQEGLDVTARQVDILSDNSVRAFAVWVDKNYEAIDALVNNAGILLERTYTVDENVEVDGLVVEIDLVKQILETNLLGTLRMIQKLVPSIKKGGRVINVSSRMGQFEWAGSNMIGYRLSKTALNGLTANLAVALSDRNISVNCLCPGWVRTEMGSKFAHIEVEEGAETAVWLAAAADPEITGKFFFEKQEIPW